MSLINKMLQELDKRHASPGGETQQAGQKLAMSLRPMAGGGVGSEAFWWAIAVVMLILIAWLGWVMWQLTPRSVVTDLAYQHRQRMESMQSRPRPEAPPEQVIAPVDVAEAASVATRTGVAPATVVAVTAAVPTPAPASKPELPPQIDMLKLATAIATPILERRAGKASTSSESAKAGLAKSDAAKGEVLASKADLARADAAKSANASATAPAPASAMLQAPKAISAAKAEDPKPVAPVAPRAAQVVASVDAGRIDKRVTSTPLERAEAEYRRAVGFVNQGRVSEGMEGLRTALVIEAAHEAARQTLVSLLMEQRRFDEAFTAAQQGLELHPANSSFAMLTARILVERRDMNGALGVMQKYAPAATGNAEYHAFSAALYQRLGRHSDAVEEYQIALRLAPQTGTWWVGLGISQEASDRRKEALSSFQRAQSAGNLSQELVAYVDQRLRQLR